MHFHLHWPCKLCTHYCLGKIIWISLHFISSLLPICFWKYSLNYCSSGFDRPFALGWDLLYQGWDVGEAREGSRAENVKERHSQGCADTGSAPKSECPLNFAAQFPHPSPTLQYTCNVTWTTPAHTCNVLYSPAFFILGNECVSLWSCRSGPPQKPTLDF